MYHCCRPIALEEYLRKGICRPSAQRPLEELQARLLAGCSCPAPTEAALKQVIARTAALDVTLGNVSVGLDGRFLVDHCSHYLILR